MKNNLECGSIVLNKNMDKLIVVFQKLSNKWGLPKGHMNQKEITDNDKMSCAIRETWEETGLSLVKNLNCKIIGKFNMNNKLFFIFHLLIDKFSLKPIDTCEISSVKWININEIKNFIEFNNSNRSLRELNKRIEILSNKISRRNSLTV